ncbi:DUF1801 domain-containing protein [Paraflavitalea sp. CAU 1676]|uniref:DUF1801 domain-containing protein n=1 Tax=Paraflavitalea sp. CAU 1676 TaxID=3032598 RepID=UPI0023DBEB92|nr:DUF1801 domain-containing protein [Paraflavitalea sp. CAU 1676]MDF2187564.1 DUF1801 domain-containing protein [Paraflavitalea sp. CAU 1676]
MAQNKTTATTKSVKGFIEAVPDEQKRADSFQLVEIIEEETGFTPTMWGPTIIGFGSYHYVYDSGHEGDSALVGFSPRKDALVLYLDIDPETREEQLKQLGKVKSGKSCVYVKRLADIDLKLLRKMIKTSLRRTIRKDPPQK